MTDSSQRPVELREISRAVRRGWRWVVVGSIVGVLLAVLFTAIMPPQYRVSATVLLRDTPDSPSAGLSGGNSDRPVGLLNLLTLGGGLDTEMAILTSRAVAAAVVDALGLQAQVVQPKAKPLAAIFADMNWDPFLARPAAYRFERSGGGYAVNGPGVSATLVPGEATALAHSRVVLRADTVLPDVFVVEVINRQDAISRHLKRLRVSQLGGEVAEVVFRAADAHTAAAVPNETIAHYLVRRRTSDRGVNQRRYEMLADHTDSLRIELTEAERALRREQEASGLLDPEVQGRAELEQLLSLRGELDRVGAEVAAFQAVLRQSSSGRISPRDLAAYPTFLGNPAINNLLSQLITLDGERTKLLELRTERDPDVQLVDRQIRHLEDQLVSTSSAYLRGLERKQAELRREVRRYDLVLNEMPAKAEANYRALREVERLSETLLALETQLVGARLAALTEGGDVRQVDTAEPPLRPYLPKLWLNLTLGVVGGLFFGIVGAASRSLVSPRVRDRYQVERVTGIPTIDFEPYAPLVLGGVTEAHAILIIPLRGVGESVCVAERVAATEAIRGRRVVHADWIRGRTAPSRSETIPANELARLGPAADSLEQASTAEGTGYLVYRGDGAPATQARRVISELESGSDLVIVSLPGIDDPVTVGVLMPPRAAILVAERDVTLRAELEGIVLTLERLAVPLLGIVLRGPAQNGT